MLSKPLPDRVDPHALARENICLEGAIALSSFSRLVPCLCHGDGDVEVRLAFHLGKKGRVVIMGGVKATVSMECQYCLEPVELEVEAEVDMVIAESDDQVRDLSHDEDAVLLTGSNVPVTAIIEDDLILSLPMVARHETGDCMERLGYEPPATGDDAEDEHPFSELSKLKEAFGQQGKKL